MKVVITGAAGFIGRALCKELSESCDVIALTTNPQRAEAVLHKSVQIVQWDGKTLGNWQQHLDNADALINLAGENIASKRWTNARRKKILKSRIDCIKVLFEAVKNAKSKPKVFIQASAIGFYGTRREEKLVESSTAGTGFLADVCKSVENSAAQFDSLGIRTILLRTSLVLGKNGGALPKLIRPFKFFLGGPIGSGNQQISWISLADEIAAIKFLMQNTGLSGPFNLASPKPVTNKEFCSILSEILKRPCWLPVPAAVLRLLFSQMADEVLLASQDVYPEKLLRAGFHFQYPDLSGCLKKILIENALKNF